MNTQLKWRPDAEPCACTDITHGHCSETCRTACMQLPSCRRSQGIHRLTPVLQGQGWNALRTLLLETNSTRPPDVRRPGEVLRLEQLGNCGLQVILGNTHHLADRPGIGIKDTLEVSETLPCLNRRHSQGSDSGAGGRLRLAADTGQHVPFRESAGQRPGGRHGRPARLHGVAAPHAHRLWRLPGAADFLHECSL